MKLMIAAMTRAMSMPLWPPSMPPTTPNSAIIPASSTNTLRPFTDRSLNRPHLHYVTKPTALAAMRVTRQDRDRRHLGGVLRGKENRGLDVCDGVALT